jgi:hypothetical protein
MHTLFIILLLVASVSNTPSAANNRSSLDTRQSSQSVTEADIEHFMSVAFGDFAAQGKRRLTTWRDSAAVQLREVPDGDRKMVLDVISEINQVAGRTMYYVSETGTNVEFSLVSAEALAAQNSRNPEFTTALIHSMRIARTGHIESVRVLVRKDMSPEARLATTRFMLTKVLGMMYLSMDGKPSIFHGTKSTRRYEARDKVAVRLIAAHANDAGMLADDFRKLLMAKYVSAPSR